MSIPPRRLAFILAVVLLAGGIGWWVARSNPPAAPLPAPTPRPTPSVARTPAPDPSPAPAVAPEPSPAAPTPAPAEKTFIDPDGIEMRETPQGPRPVRPL